MMTETRPEAPESNTLHLDFSQEGKALQGTFLHALGASGDTSSTHVSSMWDVLDALRHIDDAHITTLDDNAQEITVGQGEITMISQEMTRKGAGEVSFIVGEARVIATYQHSDDMPGFDITNVFLKMLKTA
jgi:hypothetical protein